MEIPSRCALPGAMVTEVIDQASERARSPGAPAETPPDAPDLSLTPDAPPASPVAPAGPDAPDDAPKDAPAAPPDPATLSDTDLEQLPNVKEFLERRQREDWDLAERATEKRIADERRAWVKTGSFAADFTTLAREAAQNLDANGAPQVDQDKSERHVRGDAGGWLGGGGEPRRVKAAESARPASGGRACGQPSCRPIFRRRHVKARCTHGAAPRTALPPIAAHSAAFTQLVACVKRHDLFCASVCGFAIHVLPIPRI